MKIEVKKHGFFDLPSLADGETDIYCKTCYEVLIFDEPAAAGVYELDCPICGYQTIYKKGFNNE